MASASPVRGDVLERAVALRTLGKEWRHIAAELGVGVDQVSAAVRRHNLAAGVSLGSECAPVLDSRILNAPAGPRPPAASSPAVHTTSKTTAGNFLIISDLQAPFGHPLALDFCRKVRKDYNVPLSNVLCVGDEVDQWWASKFDPKSPDALYTATQEIDESIKELMRWYEAFPDLRICNSNHGARWAKRAARSGIPSRMMRDYREVLNHPPGWRWADYWIIDGGRLRFRTEHGDKRPTGQTGLRQRPLWRGMPVAYGHEHMEPATLHIDTDDGRELWSMRTGSLMDRRPTDANDYAKNQAGLPSLTVGVVTDGGRNPSIVRF